MSIKIETTTHSTSLLDRDGEEGSFPPGSVQFELSVGGTAGEMKEVLALIAQITELAEDGVVTSVLLDQPAAPAEHHEPAAPTVASEAVQGSVPAKRKYTRREVTAPAAPVAPQVVASAIDMGEPLVAPTAAVRQPELPLRAKQADVPAADPGALTSEELAAYEEANPFSDEPTPKAPAPKLVAGPPAVPPVVGLPQSIRGAKNIRELLSAMAHELGERTAADGTVTGEPSVEEIVAYAEKHAEALAKECELFKMNFSMTRIKNGAESLYESRPAT